MPDNSESPQPDSVAEVLSQYAPQYQTTSIHSLGNADGFSGSQLWRCATASGSYCLKRWPEKMQLKRLTKIHAVLRHVEAHGVNVVPLPVANQAGRTVTIIDDTLWELTQWLEGEPLLHEQATPELLERALEQLALFHHAASSYQSSVASSPGLAQRRDELQMWRTFRLKTAQQALRNVGWSDFEARSLVAFDLFRRTGEDVEQEVTEAADLEIPLQFSIRDVRAEHILFSGEQVTGIVDFGAMRSESPTGDIARLVGTTSELANKWKFAIQAYTKFRTLTKEERELVPLFYRSGVILGALNWIWWIVVEKREFDNPASVLNRLDTLLRQWEQLDA